MWRSWIVQFLLSTFSFTRARSQRIHSAISPQLNQGRDHTLCLYYYSGTDCAYGNYTITKFFVKWKSKCSIIRRCRPRIKTWSAFVEKDEKNLLSGTTKLPALNKNCKSNSSPFLSEKLLAATYPSTGIRIRNSHIQFTTPPPPFRDNNPQLKYAITNRVHISSSAI